MIRPILFFVLPLFLEACSAPTVPSPVQSLAIPTPYASAIPVSPGVTVERTDTFIGNPLIYALGVPSDGTLVVRLNWDPTKGNEAAHLMLTIGECAVPYGFGYPNCSDAQNFPPGTPSPPVIGRMIVSAGRTYRVIVDEGLAPWDYGFYQPFTLTAVME
jgi:hypothetical protein